MLKFINTLFSHLTGQAFNKSILGAIASAAVPTILGGLMGGDDGPAPMQTNTQANNFTASDGLFNTSFQDGNLSMGMSPQMQAIQNLILGNKGLFGAQPTEEQMAQLGTLRDDFLGTMETDPMEVAQMQFDRMSPLLNQQFDQQALNQESRLFAQGRLGSTGGAQQQNALMDSRNDALSQLLHNSYGQGMSTQMQNANLGMGFMNAMPQLQNAYSALGNNPLNQLLAMQQGGISLGQFGGNLAGSSGTSTGGGYNPMQSMGQGLMSGGINTGINALQGLFTSSPSIPQQQQPIDHVNAFGGGGIIF